MTVLSAAEIEEALLPFRIGRRLVLDRLIARITAERLGLNSFRVLSRFFSRLKSADSVLEKIQRRGIELRDVSEIPEKISDILGFRIITENTQELYVVDKFLQDEFEIVSRKDQVTWPSEFGYKGIEYALRHHASSEAYPFELQLRTLIQHYGASQSFKLFHKKSRETALNYRDSLLALFNALGLAENAADSLPEDSLPNRGDEIPRWRQLPLYNRVNLVVVESHERLADHVVLPLTHNDQVDHDAIVAKKLDLYSAYPKSAIVECSCLHFLSFALNEPNVCVPVDRLERVKW